MPRKAPTKKGYNGEPVGYRNPPVATQIKKGEVRNPGGRPKKEKTIFGMVRDRLDEVAPNDKQGRTWRQLLTESVMLNAIKGNGTAMKELFGRVDGPLPQEITHTTPTTINFVCSIPDEDDE